MSDIIKDAKHLLDGATPAPWEVDVDGLEVYSTVDGDAVAHAQTPSDADLIAAAPENAQALAEETWEYSYHVQNTIGMWEHPTPWAGETGKWWETKEDAEESALAAHEYGYLIRIVRRRVSPPEVINE